MATNEETNAAGTDTRLPMLVESDYDSWKIRIHRYIRGKPNGKLIWNSIQNGPTPHPMVTDPPPTDSTIMPAPYDQPQALTTTNMFQANHEDAYDSDVDEGPNAVVAFMANLSSTSATNNPINE
ncbi:hypothetical protein Tco_1566746, partial [Tanacetum coccineum]